MKFFILFFLGSCALLFAQAPSEPIASHLPVTIDLVTVGDPGNHIDLSTFGAVEDSYQIGKYDITAEQYCAFLNAVATGSGYTLYHKEMGSDLNVASITCTTTNAPYHYTVIPGREKLPIVHATLQDAVYFANWIENGQLSGVEGERSLTTGAFIYNNDIGWIPNKDAHWSLPTEDEWYKAAYYNREEGLYWTYPTQNDIAPGNTIGNGADQPLPNQANYNNQTFYFDLAQGVKSKLTPVGFFTGSPGPYGTFDMGGNVYQLTRSFDQNGAVVIRGGSWKSPTSLALSSSYSNNNNPQYNEGRSDVGFRLVYRKKNPQDSSSKHDWLDVLPPDIKSNVEEDPFGNAVNSAFTWQAISWLGKEAALPAVETGAAGAAEVIDLVAICTPLAIPVLLGVAAVAAYELLPSSIGNPLSIALGGASLLELTVPRVIIPALRAIGSVAAAARTYFGTWL